MSDSGESEESERLSSLNAIAEALRAGELDTETRFARKRGETKTTFQTENGKQPSEILDGIRSNDESRRQNNAAGWYEVDWDPDSDLDVLIQLQESKEEADQEEILGEVVQVLVEHKNPPQDDERCLVGFKEFPNEVYVVRQTDSGNVVVSKRSRENAFDREHSEDRTKSTERRGRGRFSGLRRRRSENRRREKKGYGKQSQDSETKQSES